MWAVDLEEEDLAVAPVARAGLEAARMRPVRLEAALVEVAHWLAAAQTAPLVGAVGLAALAGVALEVAAVMRSLCWTIAARFPGNIIC